MKKCNDHMTVLVIDSKSEKSYIRRKITILPAMADAQSMPYKPKRVHLKQGPDGYGFLLRHEKLSTGRTGMRHAFVCYCYRDNYSTTWLCVIKK